MKTRIGCLVLLLTLTGCSPKPFTNASLYNNNQSPVTGSLLLGTFQGTLPCADCPGIQTELSLYHPNLYTDEGTYVLKLTYLDRAVEPIVTQGEWTILRGDAADENASVYQLEPDHPEKSSYYLRVNAREIRMLDKDEKEMKTKLNFTLKRVSTSLP
jgi:copper homeostasis protein (lipoprotein)